MAKPKAKLRPRATTGPGSNQPQITGGSAVKKRRGYGPNSNEWKVKTRKRNVCQKCEAKVPLKDQYYVTADLDSGEVRKRKNVTKRPETESHYCQDCADNRVVLRKQWIQARDEGRVGNKARPIPGPKPGSAGAKRSAKAAAKGRKDKAASRKKASDSKPKAKKATGKKAKPKATKATSEKATKPKAAKATKAAGKATGKPKAGKPKAKATKPKKADPTGTGQKVRERNRKAKAEAAAGAESKPAGKKAKKGRPGKRKSGKVSGRGGNLASEF